MRLFALAFCGLALAPAFCFAKPVSTVPRTEPQHQCSRSVSRAVRKVLDKEVLKLATKAGMSTWPEGCPLDPAKDLYAGHEKQKSRRSPGSPGISWTCGICGKAFKNEHYLDLHFENKHMNETPAEPVCLADYCEAFEVCHGEQRWKPRYNKDGACDDKALAKARHLCEDAMVNCFPLDKPESRLLHAQLSRHWCQVLDCRIREEKKKENDSTLIPVIVLMILIVLIGFIVFSIVVCCVDYSDDVIQFLVDSKLASTGFAKGLVKARETTKQAVGQDRTKRI